LIPDLWANLFSITKATSLKSCKVICEDNLITVHSPGGNIHFNTVLQHGDGKILSTDFYTSLSTMCIFIYNKSNISRPSSKIGPSTYKKVFDTAKFYGIKVQSFRDDPVCEDFAISKIRVKNLGHNDNNETNEIGERIYIDISSTKNVSYGGSKFWLLIQDDYSEYIWS
jgi:hypothetical protein